MGKMVVFEWIRRCMDSWFNLFLINRVYLNERVYVFSEFYFDIDKYWLMVNIGVIVDVKYDKYFSIMKIDNEIKVNFEVKIKDIEEKGRENKLSW